MKKLLFGLVIIIAVTGGGLYYLSSNSGQLIKSSIENYVPEMIGANVTLARVELDVINGQASLNDMVIYNPDGFKSDHLFKIGTMMVNMDVTIENLTSDVININEIRLDGADMIYEMGSNGNNVGKIQQNIDAYMVKMGLDMSDDSEKKFIVDHVYINGTKVKLSSDLLGGKAVDFTIPDLHLTDIGKRENGALASDVIKQIFAAISGSVSDVAQSELLKNTIGDVNGNVVKEIEDKIGGALRGLIPSQ